MTGVSQCSTSPHPSVMKTANSQTVMEHMLARCPRPCPIFRASLACGAATELPSHVHHMPGKLESWGPVLDPNYKQVFASCLTVMTHCDCCDTCNSGLSKNNEITQAGMNRCEPWKPLLCTAENAYYCDCWRRKGAKLRYGRQRHLNSAPRAGGRGPASFLANP